MSIYTHADRAALTQALALHIVDLAQAAIAARGRFMWALSGGSTPEQLYRLLGEAEHASRIDWQRVQLFFGDERCVEPNDPQSNYRMAKHSLFDRVNLLPSQIHRLQGEAEPTTAALTYEQELRQAFGDVGDKPPRFDLILLGLGNDGHTASLFPNSPALKFADQSVGPWVRANYAEQLGAWRLTLMPHVINAARVVAFLISGTDKASIVAQVLRDGPAGEAFPARRIRPQPGVLEWWLDAAAAAELVTKTPAGVH